MPNRGITRPLSSSLLPMRTPTPTTTSMTTRTTRRRTTTSKGPPLAGIVSSTLNLLLLLLVLAPSTLAVLPALSSLSPPPTEGGTVTLCTSFQTLCFTHRHARLRAPPGPPTSLARLARDRTRRPGIADLRAIARRRFPRESFPPNFTRTCARASCASGGVDDLAGNLPHRPPTTFYFFLIVMRHF